MGEVPQDSLHFYLIVSGILFVCVFCIYCVELVANQAALWMKYGVSNNGLFRGEGVTPVCKKT